MKIINFIAPWQTKEAYGLLVTCSYSSFDYAQTAEYLRDLGYYLPEDQYKVFNTLQNIMVDLDIGNRQDET